MKFPELAVFIAAGLHVPVIPFVEVVGNTGAELFWHNDPIALNAGMVKLLTVMVMEAPAAHCPPADVKVYVLVPTVAVLIVEGFQVPEIPFVEVVGSVGAILF